MKFVALQLDTVYAYRSHSFRRAVMVPVYTLLFKTDLSVNKLGQTIGQISALVRFEDGREEWVSIGELRKKWTVADAQKLKKTHPKQIIAVDIPTKDSALYWRSNQKVKLDPNKLSCYVGFEKETLSCANPSEAWVVKWLNRHRIKFDYEPMAFASSNGVNAFRPDFFLAEFGIYLGLSSSRRSRASHKRVKLQMMEKDYPSIRVTVIYWEEILYLANQNPSKAEFIQMLFKLMDQRKEAKQRILAKLTKAA